jgi:hypothetical protein
LVVEGLVIKRLVIEWRLVKRLVLEWRLIKRLVFEWRLIRALFVTRHAIIKTPLAVLWRHFFVEWGVLRWRFFIKELLFGRKFLL